MKKKLVFCLAIEFLMAVVAGFAQNTGDFQISGGVLVKYIGNGGNVTIPAGVTSIGAAAFQSKQLISVTIPNSVTSIERNAFDNCKELTSITLPASLTSIRQGAFRVTGLRNIILPDGVTTIEADTFYSCKSLTSITLPTSLTSIGAQAFDGCESLTSIALPKGLTSIGAAAFRRCKNLNSIMLPEGLTSIGDYAFALCTNLNSVFVPGSLQIAYQFPSSVTVFDSRSILKRIREEYINNPRSGDADWKGKVIGVAAKIESFEPDGSVVIVQTLDTAMYRSVCRFNASLSGNLIRYDLGSEIKIMGTVAGMGRLSSGASVVVLYNCIF